MDVLRMARESGLAVILDGRIGRQEYSSVSGSTDALKRFAEAVRLATLRKCSAVAHYPGRLTYVRQRNGKAQSYVCVSGSANPARDESACDS